MPMQQPVSFCKATNGAAPPGQTAWSHDRVQCRRTLQRLADQLMQQLANLLPSFVLGCLPCSGSCSSWSSFSTPAGNRRRCALEVLGVLG